MCGEHNVDFVIVNGEKFRGGKRHHARGGAEKFLTAVPMLSRSEITHFQKRTS
ncbi:MAG: hypothetical protein L6V93_10130 [Clostridiales bacterium]|nr:MAG: hypothetical protein L6V93_10130 [Clostridiales bacterium]